MADIGALMVSTFRKWLSPILIACHTANHTQGFVTIDYESVYTIIGNLTKKYAYKKENGGKFYFEVFSMLF